MNEQAENMFSRLVTEYADKQGVTEQLKAKNQLEWVGRMNNIQACAREVVEREMIILLDRKSRKYIGLRDFMELFYEQWKPYAERWKIAEKNIRNMV